MAKKVVATLKKEGGEKFVKVIRTRKNTVTGSYNFKEQIMNATEVDEFLKG